MSYWLSRSHHFEGFYGRHHDLANRKFCITYNHGYVPFVVVTIASIFLFFMACHQILKTRNITGATSEAGTAFHSGAPQFTTKF